ncbi:hypothetical protein FOA52_007884, partial [Chlamydomonas sp. UWO 241]
MKDVVTSKSDIWSVGCLLVEVLTGSPPYFDRQPMSALFHIVADDHPPLPPGVSPLMSEFLMECFQKDPSQRPSAADLLQHRWISDRRRGLAATWRGVNPFVGGGAAYRDLSSVITRELEVSASGSSRGAATASDAGGTGTVSAAAAAAVAAAAGPPEAAAAAPGAAAAADAEAGPDAAAAAAAEA